MVPASPRILTLSANRSDRLRPKLETSNSYSTTEPGVAVVGAEVIRTAYCTSGGNRNTLVVLLLVTLLLSDSAAVTSAEIVKLPVGTPKQRGSPALSIGGQWAWVSKFTLAWLCAGIAGKVTLKVWPLRTNAAEGALPEPGGQTAGPFGLGPGSAWQVALSSNGRLATGCSMSSTTLVAGSGPLFEIVTENVCRSWAM